jgi:rubredoxin
MAKYRCNVCGYIYDEEMGESSTKTPPGTKFSNLPNDWACPMCGAPKEEFVLE